MKTPASLVFINYHFRHHYVFVPSLAIVVKLLFIRTQVKKQVLPENVGVFPLKWWRCTTPQASLNIKIISDFYSKNENRGIPVLCISIRVIFSGTNLWSSGLHSAQTSLFSS